MQGPAAFKGKAKVPGVFKKENVRATMQGPPWKDIASGKKVDATLITVTKED